MRVSVRVTSKASRAGVGGAEVGADGSACLKVRVTAAPEKGKANAAVIRLLAKQWGLASSSISVVSVDTSRAKTLEISGDVKSLLRDLDEWLKQQKTGAR